MVHILSPRIQRFASGNVVQFVTCGPTRPSRGWQVKLARSSDVVQMDERSKPGREMLPGFWELSRGGEAPSKHSVSSRHVERTTA